MRAAGRVDPETPKRRNGEIYVVKDRVYKAPTYTPLGDGRQSVSMGFWVCTASPAISALDIAKTLAAGEAAEALIEYARAAEIIDRHGAKLDAATEIGGKALDAYHAGGSAGLLEWLRVTRGLGLAIARGEDLAASAKTPAEEDAANEGPRALPRRRTALGWEWPLSFMTTARPDQPLGNGHVYIVDATGKKLASLWGSATVKMNLCQFIIDAQPAGPGEDAEA